MIILWKYFLWFGTMKGGKACCHRRVSRQGAIKTRCFLQLLFYTFYCRQLKPQLIFNVKERNSTCRVLYYINFHKVVIPSKLSCYFCLFFWTIKRLELFKKFCHGYMHKQQGPDSADCTNHNIKNYKIHTFQFLPALYSSHNGLSLN